MKKKKCKWQSVNTTWLYLISTICFEKWMISVCPKLYLLFVALGGGRERLHQVVEGSEGLGRDRSCRSRTGKELHLFYSEFS